MLLVNRGLFDCRAKIETPYIYAHSSMQNFWISKVVTVLVFSGLILIAYHERVAIKNFIQDIHGRLSPCSETISYKITSIDPRFNMATSTLSGYIQKAATIWNTAAGKQLITKATSEIGRAHV